MKKIEIKWAAKNGQELSIVVRVAPMLTRSGDVRTDGAVDVVCEAYINGVSESATIERVSGHSWAVAKMGKIGLNKERHAEVVAAVAECANDPAIVAFAERERAADAAHQEYKSQHDLIERKR